MALQKPEMSVRNDDGSVRSGLAQKVSYLSQTRAYPVKTERVDARQTHMSWIFLTDTEAWKLKKPIRLPPLDFTTPARRRRSCETELRLNRRLAADVYLSVHRLTRESGQDYAIDGAGRTTDWLLRMRRLPEERMLDTLIGRRAVRPNEVCNIAGKLACFYKAREPIRLSPHRLIRNFRKRLHAARNIMQRFGHLIDTGNSLLMFSHADDFLTRHAALLGERIRSGRILEGHGDLRAEHVCLEAWPQIIDCLEFSKSLRQVDPFEEIAFLGLDCARIGADWIAPLLREELTTRLQEEPHRELIRFYTRFHACNRARLALRHLLDEGPDMPERWPAMSDAFIHACMRLTD